MTRFRILAPSRSMCRVGFYPTMPQLAPLRPYTLPAVAWWGGTATFGPSATARPGGGPQLRAKNRADLLTRLRTAPLASGFAALLHLFITRSRLSLHRPSLAVNPFTPQPLDLAHPRLTTTRKQRNARWSRISLTFSCESRRQNTRNRCRAH